MTATHFTGTGALLRLSLRRDRLRMPIWILAFFVFVAASVLAVVAAYPDQEALQSRATLLNNPATRLMTGPAFGVEDYTTGAAVANELSLWVMLPSAIMGVLFTTRHTRAEEDSGRLEMLRALPISRHAPLAAALLVALLYQVLVAVAVTAALLSTALPAADSFAFGAGVGLTGMVFAALTMVAAQLTTSARAATGIGLGLFALAFVIRGIGDVLEPQGSWLSWLSPIAWVQQTRLYVDLRWWPLLLSAAAVLLTVAVAVVLGSRRDLGAGLFGARPGPAAARAPLLSPGGLALRLLTPGFVTWTAIMALFSAAFGALSSEVDSLFSAAPAVTEWVTVDPDSLTRSFGALLLSLVTLAPLVLAVHGMVRLRSEEQAGRVSGLLLAGSSRPGVVLGWSAVVAVEATVMQILLGLSLGGGMAASLNEASWIGEMTLASLAYLPVLLFFIGLSAVLSGVVARASGLVWVVVGWSGFVLIFAEMFSLPEWSRWLSPLWHVPLVPDAELGWLSLGVLTVSGAALAVAGAFAFRRRDIAEN